MSDETPAPTPTPPATPADGAAGGRDEGPSPYDALRPAGDRAFGPAAWSGHVSGPLGWLVNDAGLKILALLLAFMLWHLVRGRIELGRDATVDVTLVPPAPDIRVVGGPQRANVKLKLFGTRAEVERVKSELGKPGTHVSYRFAVDGGDDGRIGPIADPNRFDFSVEGAASVISEMAPVEARWVRVEKRPIPFAKRLDIEPTGRGDVEVGTPEFPDFPDRTVEVEAPRALFRGESAITSLQPDPIDVRAWLAGDPDFLTPFSFELGFDRWRTVPGRGSDVVTITPPRVKGKVRVYLRPAAALESGVRALLAGSEFDRYGPFDLQIKSAAYDNAAKRLKLDVRGDPKVLDGLRAEPLEWSFAISLPAAPATGESAITNKEVPVFLWFRKGEAPPSVRLVGSPTVFVTLRKRD